MLHGMHLVHICRIYYSKGHLKAAPFVGIISFNIKSALHSTSPSQLTGKGTKKRITIGGQER